MRDRRKPNPIEMEFVHSKFFDKWIVKYPHLLNISVPYEVTRTLRPNRIYPIKFADISPLYLARIISISGPDGNETVKIRLFLENNSLIQRFQLKKIVSGFQLLSSSKKCIIPINILTLLLVATQIDKWDSKLEINKDFEIKYISVELIPLHEFNIGIGFKKLVDLNAPKNRFPGFITTPDSRFLNCVPLDREFKIDNLLDPNIKFIGFTYRYFNINNSFYFLPELQEETKKKKNKSRKNKRSINRPQSEGKSELIIQFKNIKRKNRNRKKPIKMNNRSANVSPYSELIGENPAEINHLLSDSSERNNELETSESRYKSMTKEKQESDNSKNLMEIETENNQNTVSVLRRSNRQKKSTESDNKDDSPIETENGSPNGDSDTLSERKLKEAEKKKENEIFKRKAEKVMRRWKTEKDFIEEYHDFYSKLYNHLPRIPKMGWLEVDVFKLFKQTIQRGGFKEATKRMLWKDIYKCLNSTTVVSNAATTMKSHYRKLLLEFEDYLISMYSGQHSPVSEEVCQRDLSNGANECSHCVTDGPHEAHRPPNTQNSMNFTIDTILNQGELVPTSMNQVVSMAPNINATMVSHANHIPSIENGRHIPNHYHDHRRMPAPCLCRDYHPMGMVPDRRSVCRGHQCTQPDDVHGRIPPPAYQSLWEMDPRIEHRMHPNSPHHQCNPPPMHIPRDIPHPSTYMHPPRSYGYPSMPPPWAFRGTRYIPPIRRPPYIPYYGCDRPHENFIPHEWSHPYYPTSPFVDDPHYYPNSDRR